jgi:hypothetical protein
MGFRDAIARQRGNDPDITKQRQPINASGRPVRSDAVDI